SALNGKISTRQSLATKARTLFSWFMARSQKFFRTVSLFLDQAQCVAVGIADHQRFLEPELALRLLRYGNDARADELGTRLAQSAGKRLDVLADQRDLPVPEIVGLAFGRHQPAAGWRLVLEELDVRRSRGRHHRGDQARIVEEPVQHVLGRSAVQCGD